MSLQRILQRDLISCTPETSVKEVAKLMENEDVGAVVVLENGQPVGIVSDRDIVVRCVVRGENCSELPVKKIMTDEVHTVSVADGIFDVIQVMKKNKIRRVPVVEGTEAVGLLSMGDIYALLAEEINALAEPIVPEQPKIQEQAA